MVLKKSKGSNTFHSSVERRLLCRKSSFREYNPLKAFGCMSLRKLLLSARYNKELNPWKVLASSLSMILSPRNSLSVLFQSL